MSSARISNSKDIYIYIYTHDIRRDEKRVENLVGGNVATKARFLVHEINHTRVRVMDERRKRGNTSGSLKRSWSQQGWREREGGREGRSSNNDALRNFSFTVGWKIDGGVWLAWKITEEIPRDSRGADRPFQNLWSRLPLFHRIFIRSFIHAALPSAPCPNLSRWTKTRVLCSKVHPRWKEGNTRGGWKGRWFDDDRIVYSGIVKGARSSAKLVVNSKLINIADRGYGIDIAGIKHCS